MNRQERELILRELHRSLDERWRPEEVAQKIVPLLDLDASERQTLEKATKAGQDNFWSSMSRDFHRPKDMSRQLSVAEELFGRKVNFAPDDVAQIEAWIKDTEQAIGKHFDRNDFKADRLPKTERLKIGIDISRRQYNKRFRLAVRLEKKVRKLRREQFKRALTLASKNRLAADITWEDFSVDLNTACFIAYYVARCNLRSLFTNTAQARPYDEICDVLMQRCNRHPQATNWWAVEQECPASSHRTALLSCLEGLPPRSRRLISLRYEGSVKGMSDLAAQFGRTVQSIYAQVKRIKTRLRDCVKRRLALELQ